MRLFRQVGIALLGCLPASALAQSDSSLHDVCAQQGHMGLDVVQQANVLLLKKNGAVSIFSNSGLDDNPMLSPDGSLLVFTRRTNGSVVGTELHVRSTSNPNVDLLVFADTVPYGVRQLPEKVSPQFSPNGRAIYFLVGTSDTSWGLARLDIAARTVSLLRETGIAEYCVLGVGSLKGSIIARLRKQRLFGLWSDWYWLLNSEGKETDAVGPEAFLDEFWENAGIRPYRATRK